MHVQIILLEPDQKQIHSVALLPTSEIERREYMQRTKMVLLHHMYKKTSMQMITHCKIPEWANMCSAINQLHNSF